MNFYKGRRVLVTGAGGFVGTVLSNKLVELGASVVGIDNLLCGDRERIHRDVDFHLGGVEQMEDRLFANVDVVFHLATVNQEMAEIYPELALETNVRGCLRVLERSKDAGVSRVVVASSVSVFGANDETLTEESAVAGVSNYAITKIGAELYTNFFNDVKGLRCVSLRLSNVYGPGMLLHSRYCGVVGRIARAIMESKPFEVYGDGQDSRTYTYVDDVVSAFIQAGFQENAVGETLNIAGDDTYTTAEVAEYFGVAQVFIPRRSVDVVPRRKVSNEKAERVLRWRPQVPMFWKDNCGAERMVLWAEDFLSSGPTPAVPSAGVAF